MTGLISKQDAINAVSEYALKHTDLDADKLNGLIKVIMKLQEPQRWILCSEQLPEIRDDVIVSTTDGEVTLGEKLDEEFYDNPWYFIDTCRFACRDIEVVAWMPLPEHFEAFDGAMNPTEE